MLALVVSVLVTVRVSFVPSWEKDAEAQHMRLVEGQMSTLLSLLDQQVGNETASALTTPVSLRQPSTSVFAGARLPHTFSFEETGAAMRFAAPSLWLIERNGTDLSGAQESWSGAQGASLTGVSRMESFRMRLDSIAATHVGDEVVFTVTNATGAYAGDLRLTVSAYPSGFNVDVRVRDATSTVLYDQGDAFFQQTTIAPYYLDLLDERFRFDRVLGSAATPYDVAATVTNIDGGGGNLDFIADYAATYIQWTAEGTFVVGTGAPVVAYNESYAGGLLRFASRNQYFVEQDYVLENGALVLNQSQGSVFRSEPAVRVSLVGNVTDVEVVLPTLEGENVTLSTRSTAIVSLAAFQHNRITAKAPSLTIEITTAFPDLWSSFWTSELGALAGFTDGTHYAVATNASVVTVQIYGSASDPASSYTDLLFDLSQADIELTISE